MSIAASKEYSERALALPGRVCADCKFHALEQDSAFGRSLARDSLAYTKCTRKGTSNCACWIACREFRPREEA